MMEYEYIRFFTETVQRIFKFSDMWNTVTFLWPHNVVTRDICYDKVCPFVYPTHTWVTLKWFKMSKYATSTMNDVSSSWGQILQTSSPGFTPNQCVKERLTPVNSENWTIISNNLETVHARYILFFFCIFFSVFHCIVFYGCGLSAVLIN